MTTRLPLGKVIIGIAATAAAGYVLGLLTPEERKRQYKEKMQELKGKMHIDEIDQRVRDIYNSVSSEATHRYEEVRKAFMDKLAAFQGSVEEIDEKKYKTALKDLMADLKDQGDLSQDQLQKLKGYFEKDYRLLKR